MTRNHHGIIQHWADAIRAAMFRVHDPDAAYRLTVALVRRVRELGYTV